MPKYQYENVENPLFHIFCDRQYGLVCDVQPLNQGTREETGLSNIVSTDAYEKELLGCTERLRALYLVGYMFDNNETNVPMDLDEMCNEQDESYNNIEERVVATLDKSSYKKEEHIVTAENESFNNIEERIVAALDNLSNIEERIVAALDNLSNKKEEHIVTAENESFNNIEERIVAALDNLSNKKEEHIVTAEKESSYNRNETNVSVGKDSSEDSMKSEFDKQIQDSSSEDVSKTEQINDDDIGDFRIVDQFDFNEVVTVSAKSNKNRKRKLDSDNDHIERLAEFKSTFISNIAWYFSVPYKHYNPDFIRRLQSVARYYIGQDESTSYGNHQFLVYFETRNREYYRKLLEQLDVSFVQSVKYSKRDEIIQFVTQIEMKVKNGLLLQFGEHGKIGKKRKLQDDENV